MAACAAGSPMVITPYNNTDIFYPSFPKNFADNRTCVWKIVANHSVGIEVLVKESDVEEKYELSFRRS